MRHPFCGRTCASKYGDYVYPRYCKRVGCNKTTFVEQNGYVHPYCGRSCADIALSQMNQIGSVIDLETTIEQLNPLSSPLSTTSNSTILSDFCE